MLMRDQLYRDIILEHWQHPQNYGIIPNADIDVRVNNPYCGDNIRLTIKLNDGRIKDIAFTGVGCAISKASASLFTEEMRHKALSSLQKIGTAEVLNLIGVPLTPTRTKCALLIYTALIKVFDSGY